MGGTFLEQCVEPSIILCSERSPFLNFLAIPCSLKEGVNDGIARGQEHERDEHHNQGPRKGAREHVLPTHCGVGRRLWTLGRLFRGCAGSFGCTFAVNIRVARIVLLLLLLLLLHESIRMGNHQKGCRWNQHGKKDRKGAAQQIPNHVNAGDAARHRCGRPKQNNRNPEAILEGKRRRSDVGYVGNSAAISFCLIMTSTWEQWLL
mmetsp:Transcript_29919/g.69654  ORF Transcript_29919/g.69654 Transcript_29919/m.69654 type:complete len:205 (-) Transcript_29919:1259-1873(-)